MSLPINVARAALLLGALACLTPWMPAGAALVLGIAIALLLGNPEVLRTRKLTHRFLTLAVMGLGAGMNLHTVARAGSHGLGYTLFGISGAFLLGALLKRALKTEPDSTLLITVGTAICGGSAIAAVAPVIRAKDHEISVALGTVFLLNSVALILFPWLGHRIGLTQTQFGLWSALAIHDTSSVVGAALQYGPRALEIGTTVKLARALWIVPVTFAIGLLRERQTHAEGDTGARAKPKRPWFILGFLIAAALVTFLPALQPAGHLVQTGATRLLVLTLFLIGTGLSRETLRQVGFRPFALGVLLWVVIGSGTLGAITAGWIR